jgi:tripartite-type tricarboxylate transporter receptor subunit TctC
MTAEQTVYWDKVFAAMVRTEEWKQDLEQNFWVNGYADARSAKKRLDEEYAEYKSILTEIGLAKIK